LDEPLDPFGGGDGAPPLSDEWKRELDRRGAQIDAGEVEMIDHDEVMAWVRARLRNPSAGEHRE
jgi:hypothetical protein